MYKVYETILKLRKTSSLKEKENILKQNDSPNLRRFLEAVYNPYKTYGIEKLPQSNPGNLRWEDSIGGNTLWDLLNSFQKREITGNEAKYQIEGIFNSYTIDSIELFSCVLQKDISARCGSAIINKAFPGLIPEFNVTLAHKFEENRTEFPVIDEPKLDGIRTVTLIQDNKANFYSRNGNKFETMEKLKSQVLATFGNNVMIDSEAISGGFQNSVSNIKRKESNDSEINLWIFDILPLSEFLNETCTKTFQERRKFLEECFAKTSEDLRKNLILTPQTEVRNMDELLSIYGKHLDDGFEGSMVKSKKGMYRYTRCYEIMKLKPTETLDLKIEGVIEAEGEQKGMMGKMMSHLEDGSVAKIGSGKMTHEVRTHMFLHPEEYIGRIIEVGFQNKTDIGALRFPRFLKFRDTKKNPGGKQ